MAAKKKKPEKPGLKRPRNPFAGRPRGGAGYHEEGKYGKKDRRRGKDEAAEESEDSGA